MEIYSKENIDKKRKRIHIIIIILKVLLTIIVVPILLVNSILLLKTFLYPNETPNILGYKIFVVASGSMEPEINTGDLILVDANKMPNIGDIITYKNGEVITHRVERIIDEGTNVKYITKGDKNESVDKVLVEQRAIEGTYVAKIAGMGQFIILLQNPFILIAFFLIILALYINNKTLEDRRVLRKQKRITYESKN